LLSKTLTVVAILGELAMRKWIIGLVLGAGIAPHAQLSASIWSNHSAITVHDQAETLPPANSTIQWWVSPDGCHYSRAGRPGETVWYLIANDAQQHCRTRIIQRVFDDFR
jgi:hypothetical protein